LVSIETIQVLPTQASKPHSDLHQVINPTHKRNNALQLYAAFIVSQTREEKIYMYDNVFTEG